jgi:hypothetical protein
VLSSPRENIYEQSKRGIMVIYKVGWENEIQKNIMFQLCVTVRVSLKLRGKNKIK